MKSLLNINQTTASFTSSGRLNSYGLSEAIKAIPPSVLPTAAANTLLRVCADACASSGYKLFKSLNTMSQETYQSENTVRTHLKQAVGAGILTRREVFKSGRQMTNEYTFTKAFLMAASRFRRLADTTKRSARESFQQLMSTFLKALLSLKNALFSDPKEAPQELLPRGSKSCTQLSVSSDHQKKNNIQDDEVFEYRDHPSNEAVEFKDVRRERAAVRDEDVKVQQKQQKAEQDSLQDIITKAAKRRLFGWMKSGSTSHTPATSKSAAAQQGFNKARYERAELDFEEEYNNRPSPEAAREIGQRKLEEIRQLLKKK